MEDNGKKVIQISLSQFIILIVLLIILICVGVGLYVSALRKSNTESEIQAISEKENSINEVSSIEENNIVMEEYNNNETTAIIDENEAMGVRYNKDFEDMLVEYILDSMEEYAKNGNILKSTTGDITAEKLTAEEVNNNSKKYKEKIIEMLADKEIFGDIYKVDNKDACKYNLEKVLNNLELGTHMGTGTGKTDQYGNKVYIYGTTEIDTTTPPSGN